MNAADFVRITKTFVDNPSDVDLTKGNLLLQVRDDLLDASVFQKAGNLWVKEGSEEWLASDWLIRRVARVPMVADRILSYIGAPENFITPSGSLLDQLEYSKTLSDTSVADASQTAIEILGRRPAGTASVLYLTSDAGEGKTTLINYLARIQAEAYKQRIADWLLVPIPLGGRAFLRFDDVVVAALVNKLRFQWWYFDAFIELVRLGVIVPAFDGFEEMFVEGSAGEAVSALGSLMRNLQSAGTVLIAARKAYFEYQSFKTQARLFDAIGQDSVAFSRLALHRWEKDKFVSYASKRGVNDPELMYRAVASRLSEDHPLLTRAVLVRRLIDVAKGLDVNQLVEQLGRTPRDYFFQFVNAIVEREAKEKWLTKSGEAQEPLISVAEHHDLLAMVAQEMWLSSTDALRPEMLDVIADFFSEGAQKNPVVARQVRERLKQHSLLTSAEAVRGAFSFDHEDFRKFFLGEAIGRLLAKQARGDLQSILSVAALPKEACDHAVQCLQRLKGSMEYAIGMLQQVSAAELLTSFVRENSGGIVVWLLDGQSTSNTVIDQMTFPPDSLAGKSFSGVKFQKCYFQPTALTHSTLKGCEFADCRFDRLEVVKTTNVGRAIIKNCEVGSLVRVSEDDQLFDPQAIVAALQDYGFVVAAAGRVERSTTRREMDESTRLVERVLRIFLRTTQVNESVIQLRLGQKGSTLLGSVLPQLLKAGILVEVQYTGGGLQRRFKLAVPMQRLQDALSESGGDFRKFLGQFGRKLVNGG